MFVRIYTGADRQSHFQDMPTPDGEADSVVLEPSADITIRRTAGGSYFDWHISESREYAFVMSGELEVVIGDGTLRRFGPGTLILAEDTTGQGHSTRILGGPCVVVNVMLPG